MKKFKAYFELYGKKMQITKSAESESELKRIVSEAIIFHKVEPIELDEQEVILQKLKEVLIGFENIDFIFNKVHPNPTDEQKAHVEAFKKPVEFLRVMLKALQDLEGIMNGEDSDPDKIPSSFQERLKQMAKDRGLDLN